MGKFNLLIDTITDFVLSHGGVWTNEDWFGLLAEIQMQRFEINDDLKQYVGNVLEAFKSFYVALYGTSGIGNAELKLTHFLIEFIKNHRGRWGTGDDWHELTMSATQNGIILQKELFKYFQGVLEAVRKIYSFQLW